MKQSLQTRTRYINRVQTVETMTGIVQFFACEEKRRKGNENGSRRFFKIPII